MHETGVNFHFCSTVGELEMSTFLWIVIGLIALAALFGGKSKSNSSVSSKGHPLRIDHLHYIDVDEYECSVCGARFKKKSMVCPKCGTQFAGNKEDEDQFIEEMVLWDDDD